MNMSTLGPTELALIIGLAVIVIAGIGAWLFSESGELENCARSLVALSMTAV